MILPTVLKQRIWFFPIPCAKQAGRTLLGLGFIGFSIAIVKDCRIFRLSGNIPQLCQAISSALYEKRNTAFDNGRHLPPALSAYYLKRVYGDNFAMPNVQSVVDYIKTTERNNLNSTYHLGDTIESLVYPSSIWMDSLVMRVLISVQYGLDTQDMELL
jgi:hypothetical protein